MEVASRVKGFLMGCFVTISPYPRHPVNPAKWPCFQTGRPFQDWQKAALHVDRDPLDVVHDIGLGPEEMFFPGKNRGFQPKHPSPAKFPVFSKRFVPFSSRLWHRGLVILRILSLLLMLRFTAAAEAEFLKTLAEIRALSHEQASANLPVEVVGTVTYFDRSANNIGDPEGLILHDGTAGCYASSQVAFEERDRIHPGTRIRIKGKTNPNSFFPNIGNAEVEILGQGDMPEPHRISGRELFNRPVDSDWVEVEAVVVGIEPGGLAFTLVVEIDGRTFKVEVPQAMDAHVRAASLMQRRVRLQGVVGTIFNEARQLTGRHFFVPSFDHFIPVENAIQGGSAPLRGIASLLQSDHDIDSPVRVRGVVTQSGSVGFYLRDETASTYVQAAGSSGYPAGAQVEIEGFAAVAPFRP